MPSAVTAAPRPVTRGTVLLAAALGFFVIVLDTTIVNVALPSIGRDLGAGLAGQQWIVDGYGVVFAALLLSSGALSDRVGATRAYACGLVAFSTASVACGLAPSLGALLAARVAQGIAAAAVLPASLAIVRQTYTDPAQRTRAVAIWAAAGGGAVAAGPVIGGALTSGLDWRWVFYVNLPACALALAALRAAPRSTPVSVRLDLPGQAAAVLAVGGLAAAVIEAGRSGLGAPLALLCCAVAASAGAALTLTQGRTNAPLLPQRVVAMPVVRRAALTGLINNLAAYGQIFVIGLLFQQRLGHSPLESGLLFLPWTAVIAAVNLLSGRLSARVGPRKIMLSGLLIFAAAQLGLLTVDTTASLPVIELLIMPLGVGAGLAVPALTSTTLDAVPAGQAGLAAGLLNAARQLGGVLGVALYGALLNGRSFITGMHHTLIVGAVSTLVSAALWRTAAGGHPETPRPHGSPRRQRSS
jgi:DHA2 family methylenomycin A resistance protein-like MFS transporter